MKTRKILVTASMILGVLLISEYAFSRLDNFTSVNRAGDPVGPGVTTSKNCTSCHAGVTTVSDNTVLRNFTFGTGSETKYLPGNVYTIKFKIFAAGPVGFSSTVLRNDSNTMAGTIAPADTAETKLIFHAASGRYYLNHRVGVTSSGAKEYVFNWTAPAKGTGTVTFYFASLSSNNDVSSDGDTTYLNAYSIQEGAPTTGVNSLVKESFTVSPNPAAERLDIGFTNKSNASTEVVMYSMDGRESVTLLNEMLFAGPQYLSFNLQGRVKPGIYFVRVTNPSVSDVKKVIIY